MESMRYRRMGNSDLVVSEIGYGCWPMGGEDFGAIDDAETARAVDRAIDSGVTLFDTAPAYSHGRAEEVLGNLLVGRRGKVILVTKCGLHWDTDADPRPLRRDSSRASVLDGPGGLHASLRRLRTDYLDLWLVHWPDVSQPFDDVMAVLIEAKAAGKVRHVGVSNFRPDQIATVSSLAPLVANQVGYNLFDRRWEQHSFADLRQRGIGVMAYGSLAHGLLSGTWTRETTLLSSDWRSRGMAFRQPLLTPENLRANLDVVDRLKAVASRMGASLPQLALAWVLREPIVSTALVGFRRPEEVDENLGTLRVAFTGADLDEIDTIMAGASGQVDELPA
jgi:aryl-alcohol dehydrogenase-like predicted oxidoreductase